MNPSKIICRYNTIHICEISLTNVSNVCIKRNIKDMSNSIYDTKNKKINNTIKQEIFVRKVCDDSGFLGLIYILRNNIMCTDCKHRVCLTYIIS